jgi:transcriptional regulator with GAF, ATPase, and Fis domain
MYCLRIYGPGSHEVMALGEAMLTAGSDAENEIVLKGPGFPALAFGLSRAEGGYAFASASPLCRALVNGKRCDSILLKPGDRLEAGGSVLILDFAGHPAAGAPCPDSGTAARDVALRAGLSRLCSLVAEERDLKILLDKTMRVLLETFGGDDAFLFTLDPGGKPQVFVSTRPDKDSPSVFSDTVVAKVLREQRGVFIGNALSDPEFSRSGSVVALKLTSILCCPIEAGGKLSGVVYVGCKRPSVSFSEADLRELEIYAMVVGCLINHVGFIALQKKLLDTYRGTGDVTFIASGPAMRRVVDEANAVALGDISVLLQGETGTGKDVVARFIHQSSSRRNKPFLVVNCGTLRGDILSSELFGHKKGAFTGALRDQPGLFLAADGGTLFLDEIGEMDTALQAMLLRALETGMIRPVGQATEIKVDVRILCATNRNLEEMISAGAFRQDLFYRVNQHLICLPPLRERGEDVLLLAHFFLEKAKAQYPGKAVEGFHPDSLFTISRYAWPGNVRELANAVNKAVLFADSPFVSVSLPVRTGGWIGFDEATRRFQKEYLEKVLVICKGNKDKAAETLGMGRSTFFRHLALSDKEANPGDVRSE